MKSADFPANFDFLPRENPVKLADFSVNLPLKIPRNLTFFRDLTSSFIETPDIGALKVNNRRLTHLGFTLCKNCINFALFIFALFILQFLSGKKALRDSKSISPEEKVCFRTFFVFILCSL